MFSAVREPYIAPMVSPRLFERDLADLEPGEFEQLVHRIVRKEHPSAKKVKAPDLGADVLGDPEAASPWVLQVKHYPNAINWKKCEESLDRAALQWSPRRVTFVFPQDLTGNKLKAFNERLRDRRAGIEVDAWTASELNAALDQHPDIRHSLFEHRKDLLHSVLRAAQLSERPDADALLDHGLDLAELVNELDPLFTYELRSRAADVPQAVWQQAPFMEARITGPDVESVLSAWSRPEADKPSVTWTFSDDEVGEDARDRLYRCMAAGKTVELTDGVRLTASAVPRAMAALVSGGGPAHQRLTVTPIAQTTRLEIEVEADRSLQQVYDFDMRPAPPKPEHEAAWVGHRAGVLMYLGFRQPDETTLVCT